MSIFFHEELYRGREVLERVKTVGVTICGAGALGANIAENLARTGFGQLTVIDHDRVEERNLSTQPYQRADIGAYKATLLANSLYRAVGAPVQARRKKLDENNVAQFLKDSFLVIDMFDNSRSRRIVAEQCVRTNTPCLHAGLSSAYAEVIWNAVYRVPSATHDDLCDYPLARNLVLLTVAVTCEAILHFMVSGEQRNYSITLKDLSIQPLTL
ncbi:MAG: ThiF family adenylyltransferase [Candidatus Competibacteraceae bacterium]